MLLSLLGSWRSSTVFCIVSSGFLTPLDVKFQSTHIFGLKFLHCIFCISFTIILNKGERATLNMTKLLKSLNQFTIKHGRVVAYFKGNTAFPKLFKFFCYISPSDVFRDVSNKQTHFWILSYLIDIYCFSFRSFWFCRVCKFPVETWLDTLWSFDYLINSVTSIFNP